MIQDKLCILCMDLLKSSSTPPRWIDWEEKIAHAHLYISKDHPPPSHVPHLPTYNYTLRLNETKSLFIFVKRPLCNIYFTWNICFTKEKKEENSWSLTKPNRWNLIKNSWSLTKPNRWNLIKLLTRTANYLQKFALSYTDILGKLGKTSSRKDSF